MSFLSRCVELSSRNSHNNNNTNNNTNNNNSKRKSNANRGGDEDNAIANFNECHICNQVGVPVFHSIRCDPTNKPHWESTAGSSLISPKNPPYSQWSSDYVNRTCRSFWWGPFCRVLDPRSKHVKRWNRAVLLARGMALAVDPLFFNVIYMSVGSGPPCFYMHVVLATILTVVRTCVDLVYLCHMWIQFRLAYVSSESLVVGCGKLVWDARAIASHNLRSFKGFWLDAFVVLPVPQVVIWIVVPKLLKEERIKLIMAILLVTYLLQFLPKLYHSIYLLKKLQKVTGYIFGSVWWRFNLNLLAYFIASHVAGGCWYALSAQRLVTCLQQRCERSNKCNITDMSLLCSEARCNQQPQLLGNTLIGNQCHANLTTIKSVCLDDDGPFNYGIYGPALPVFSSNSLAIKILYPIFWGFLNLSSFGNVLSPTTNPLELTFSICITLAGLSLFVTLIGNIQVFLQTVMATRKMVQLRHRDMEWWMRRRQLPPHLRQRVHRFERHRWAAMEGQDEMELIRDLPDGLRRDIKRYLCMDLVKKVPLFHMLDDLILDNICDLVKPLIYSKGEKIFREGDPVQRMVFIVHGHVKRSQALTKGFIGTSVIQPGGFFGDELLSWCLRRPFVDHLPSSSATFVCLESTEAYCLEADHLRYITDHFRYQFSRDRLMRTMRYYSSNWRTWGAVIIQFAWRRYRMRTDGTVSPNRGTESLLRHCAVLFMSYKPHDHLE